MKKLKNLPLLIVLMLMVIGTSCKKKGGPGTPDPQEIPVNPTKPNSPDSEVKLYTPLSLITDKLKIEFSYLPKTNLISEIKLSDGKRETIEYDDKNFPKLYSRYLKDELLYKVFYINNEDGLVTKGIQYKVETDGKILTLLGNYQISYTEQKQISTISRYSFANKLISRLHFAYDQTVQLLETSFEETTLPRQNFSWDGKTGLLRNVPYAQIMAIENKEFYFLNSRSNVNTVKDNVDTANDLNIRYDYNADSYPISMTSTDVKKQNTSYKVTYR
jgi:YD repeat-containing protein